MCFIFSASETRRKVERKPSTSPQSQDDLSLHQRNSQTHKNVKPDESVTKSMPPAYDSKQPVNKPVTRSANIKVSSAISH